MATEQVTASIHTTQQRSRNRQSCPPGRTDRHRLHRGGDRDANSALWLIALVRMHSHQPTKNYVARRTAEGRTKKEILRCLKRYIAREIYPRLLSPASLGGR